MGCNLWAHPSSKSFLYIYESAVSSSVPLLAGLTQLLCDCTIPIAAVEPFTCMCSMSLACPVYQRSMAHAAKQCQMAKKLNESLQAIHAQESISNILSLIPTHKSLQKPVLASAVAGTVLTAFENRHIICQQSHVTVHMQVQHILWPAASLRESQYMCSCAMPAGAGPHLGIADPSGTQINQQQPLFDLCTPTSLQCSLLLGVLLT